MKCDICGVIEAVGFIQYMCKDTGELLVDTMGPNVCDPCAEAMCDDDDTFTVDELESA